MTFLLCFIGFAVGMGLSVQTSINGRLRRSVQSPFLTSLISFCVSTVFIAAISLATIDSLIPSSEFFASQPWWIWLGGVFGLTFLTGNILLFPKLGAVQTVIFPVLGQILAGLVIDQFGLFHAPTAPLNAIKIIGTLLVLAGVAGVVLFSKKKSSPYNRQNTAIPVFMGLANPRYHDRRLQRHSDCRQRTARACPAFIPSCSLCFFHRRNLVAVYDCLYSTPENSHQYAGRLY